MGSRPVELDGTVVATDFKLMSLHGTTYYAIRLVVTPADLWTSVNTRSRHPRLELIIMDGNITVHVADRTAWITLDRPTSRNAMTASMIEALRSAVEGVSSEAGVDVVVIRGAGTDFCAGSDMGDLASVLTASPGERGAAFKQAMQHSIQPLGRALLNLDKPLVVSARGHAIGLGVLFLLAADLVVLSRTAQITVPQVRLGHTVDHGESWLLPRKVGQAKAMQLCLLGERMSACDAERFGLANWLTDDADLESKTNAVVAGLLSVAPIPLHRTKSLLRSSLDTDLETQFDAERISAAACAETDDFVEAITAHVERRPAAFVGA
jgi:2-(1,2-epoxy-1,2-dihydrophenyl)acetyl-CoA isomerase